MKKKKVGLSGYIRENGLCVSVTLFSRIVNYSRNALYYMFKNDLGRLNELVCIAKEKIDSICAGDCK